MGKRLTTEEFIRRAQNVQAEKGREYVYNLVEYISTFDKVKIICPEHGVFKQRPRYHLKGRGCPECGKLIPAKTTRKTKNDFIEKSKKIHNDKYKYDFVQYKNMRTTVKIICPEHGAFLQTPDGHLRGHGCPKCAKEKRKETNRDKYGGNAPLCSPFIVEKTRKKNLEKYGVEWVTQTTTFKFKKEKTNLQRYGGKSPFQSKEVQEKICKTNMQKYGVKNPMQSEEIKQKVQKTVFEKYKIKNIMQLSEIKEKYLNTKHPNINYERWSSLTKEFIEENFIDSNNHLMVQELMDYVGWETPTPVYQKCRELEVKWTRADGGGFDPTKPATLYYIYDPQEDMYKIGITNHDVQTRFGKDFCSKRAIAILEQWEYQNGYEAYLAEQEVLKAFKDYRTTNPSWPEEVGGKTEFFLRTFSIYASFNQ